MYLSEEQQGAINLILDGHNVFLTGQAGTGKSVVIHEVKRLFHGNVALLAPTGIAAANIGGQTIHAFFKMDIGFNTKHTNMDAINEIDLIIIDEVSMITPDLFGCMNEYLQQYYQARNPYYDPLKCLPAFGGKQFLLVGDFYQLPPVKNDETPVIASDLICNTQDWLDLNLIQVSLTRVYRQQNDPLFMELLGRARIGKVTENDLRLLNSLRQKVPSPDAVRIVYTNERLKFVNEENLKNVKPTDVVTFSANYLQYPMRRSEIEQQIRNYPYDAELKVFVGAKVVMLRNKAPEYSNGSVGYVDEIFADPMLSDDQPASIVVNINGKKYRIGRVEFITIDSNGKELSWAQFPIRLAYAITVHKAQGQTFDAIVIDRKHRSKNSAWYKFSRM